MAPRSKKGRDPDSEDFSSDSEEFVHDQETSEEEDEYYSDEDVNEGDEDDDDEDVYATGGRSSRRGGGRLAGNGRKRQKTLAGPGGWFDTKAGNTETAATRSTGLYASKKPRRRATAYADDALSSGDADFVVDDDEVENESDDSGDGGGRSPIKYRPPSANLLSDLAKFEAPKSTSFSGAAANVTSRNLARQRQTSPSLSLWNRSKNQNLPTSLSKKATTARSSWISANVRSGSGGSATSFAPPRAAAQQQSSPIAVDDSSLETPPRARRTGRLKKKYRPESPVSNANPQHPGLRPGEDLDAWAERTLAIPDSSEDEAAFYSRVDDVEAEVEAEVEAHADQASVRDEEPVDDVVSGGADDGLLVLRTADFYASSKGQQQGDRNGHGLTSSAASQATQGGSLDFDADFDADDNNVDEGDDELDHINELVKQCETYSATLARMTSSLKQQHDPQKAQAGVSPSPGKAKHTVIAQPPSVPVRLRDYQLVGLNWLDLLRRQDMNGILADEMGLGKTCQTIAFLSHLNDKKLDPGPHIVVCPSSILENWHREILRFAPSLRPVIYHGSMKERREIRMEMDDEDFEFDVLVTSYNMVFGKDDRKFLKDFRFSYLVLDEAQAIKNAASQRYKHLRALARSCSHRLLLTGTPLQNNLSELWALLNFLMPRCFGKAEQVDLKAVLKRCDEQDRAKLESDWIGRAKKLLQPFLLRRLKSDVTSELAPKKEFLVKCAMTAEQADQYNDAVQLSRSWVADKLDTNGPKSSSINSSTSTKESTTTATTTTSSTTTTATTTKKIDDPKIADPANINKSSTVLSDNNGGDGDDNDKGDGDDDDDPISIDTDDDKDQEGVVVATGAFGSPMRRIKRSDSAAAVSAPAASSSKKSAGKTTSNVIMLLRKVANHPMLCRRIYDEERIAKMAKIMIENDPEYHNYPYQHMVEDLRINSDFELHRLCWSMEALFPLRLPVERIVQCGGKFAELHKLLTKFRDDQVKTLVFSQMTRLLDIVEVFLNHYQFKFVRLDGSTPVTERQTLIDRFQTDDQITVFLLSTKAGGLGINLTAACRVVFYDMSWNPTEDKQALDRAHRMGQTRQVEVYRLASAGTIDESIMELQAGKSRFNDRVLAEGDYVDDEPGADVKINSKLIFSLVKKHLLQNKNQ